MKYYIGLLSEFEVKFELEFKSGLNKWGLNGIVLRWKKDAF